VQLVNAAHTKNLPGRKTDVCRNRTMRPGTVTSAVAFQFQRSLGCHDYASRCLHKGFFF